MEWQAILALTLGGLVVLFPVAFIWHINIGGICALVHEKRAKKGPTKSRPE